MNKQFNTHAVITLFLFVVVSTLFQPVFSFENRLLMPQEPNGVVELHIDSSVTEQQAKQLLQVFVNNVAPNGAEVPIAGSYQVKKRTIVFKPYFEFVQTQSYSVRFKVSLDATETTESLFVIDDSPQGKASVASTNVVSVYPNIDVLPENTLRFYIQFSTPMKPHVASSFIALVNENGEEDNAAFMSFKQELWSRDRRRLTLLMDPGRIKRGVATNERLGPALEAGEHYQLMIKSGWPSADGNGYLKTFTKIFSVGEAIRTLPNTKSWTFNKPRTNSQQPLVIQFDRSFDFQQLQTSIAVLTNSNVSIPGHVDVSDDGYRWTFTPDAKWKSTEISVMVDTNLEDIAGNNFKDLLDHHVGTPTKSTDYEKIRLRLKTNLQR